MRNLTWRWLALMGAGVVLALPATADDTFPPCWRGRPGTTYQQWTFNTGANPASPEFVANTYGAPLANVTVGTAGAGWINQQPIIFGTNRAGIWDLGSSGNVSLSIPNDPAAPGGSWKYVYVQVTQYRDSLYDQLATVSIPGATLVRSQLRTNEVLQAPAFPFNGRWVVQQTVWLIEPCPASETVIISSSPTKSAAIDQVVIDTRCSTSDEGDINPPCWRGHAASTYQNWSFHDSDNPSAPESEINPGSPQAVVTLGGLALGWQDVLVGFGCRQGYWDLGSGGQISLAVPNTAGSPTSYKNIQVQVVEFQDSLAYNQLATVNIPGATLLSQNQTTVETTLTGTWVVHRSVWRIAPCPAAETVLITAPSGSALIDQVVVDTLCVDLAPTCPPNQILTADAGECSRANVTWTLPAVDGCVITSTACTPASGSTFPVGTTPVNCTISDGLGGTTTCTFNVTITDNQPPVLTCPANLVVGTSVTPLLCGAVVNFTPSVADNCPGATVVCVPASGSTFPLGTTTVTCTATDASLNPSASCSFAVTVVDFSGDENPPCWRGQPGSTYQHWAFAGNDNPAAPELESNPGSPDAEVVVGPLALGWQNGILGFGCKQGYWDLGANGTITLTVPNIAGPPTAYKYLRLQVTEFRDSLAYNVSPTKSVSGAILVSQQETSIETTLTGEWIVHESVWRFATCPTEETIVVTAPPTSALVDQIVVDTLCTVPPVCPTDISGTADPGLCVKTGITWSLPPADGCVILSVVCLTNGVPVAQPASFPIGSTAVQCAIADAEGQTNNCNFVVAISDTEAPVIASCAPPQTAPAGLTCLAAVPDFTGGVVATDCLAITVTQSPLAGTLVGLGPTVVTLTVTDAANNSTTCTTTFVVNDVTPPVFTATAPDQAASAGATCTAPVPNVVVLSAATDNCDPAVTISQSPAPGTLVGLGTTVITVTATDDAGNSATDLVDFVVSDTTPPTFTTAAPDQTASADAACQAAVPDVAALSAAADNCDPTVALSQSPAAGTLVGLGTTVITVTATDDAGNSTTDTVNFVVSDTTPPVFTTTAPDQAASAGATCTAPVPDVVALSAATDNCDPTVTLTQAPLAGTLVGLGTTVITVTATDDAGNSITDLVNFVVSDTTLPVIATCAPPQNADVAANCQVTVPDFTSGVIASDNCDASLAVTQSPAAGTLVGPGTHTITLTVADDAGNTATCTTTFTVRALADLAVLVSSSPEPVTVGQPLTYTVTVTNIGPCPASGVIVNNVLSAGQVLMSVTDPGSSIARACPTPSANVWYRGEGNADDSVGTSHGTINGGVTFTPQAVAQGFNFDGLTGYISVPDAPALRPASLTIEGWIKIQDPNGLHVLLSKPQGAGTADSYSLWVGSGVLFAAISDNTGSGPILSYPNFPTSSLFSGPDVINFPSLANKLKTPADPVSTFLNGQLSSETLTLLAAYGGGADAQLLRAILADLNDIIQSGPIYSVPVFGGVTLAPETQYLLGRNPTGIDLVRLNRLLIRDAYPTEIQSNIFPELNVRYHVAYTFDPVTQKQALYVNGALVDSSFVTKTITYDTPAMFIGAANMAGAADHFYQGEIDELTLYHRALTGIEVQAIHSAGANGKCFNSGAVVVGTLAANSSQSFTVVALPTTCPTASLQATVTGTETDPVPANNTATATATVTELDPSQLLLSIRRVSPNNNHVEISWPITCLPYQLESSDDLSPPVILWTPAVVPVQILQGRYSTVIPASDPYQFFRLKSP